MIIYVLKNEAGEYLCYDRSYGMMYTDKDFTHADQCHNWKMAKIRAQNNSALGKFDLYRWVVSEETFVPEEKDEE